MFERFTGDARQAVVLAQEWSRKLGHGHIGTEHLLLALLTEPALHQMAGYPADRTGLPRVPVTLEHDFVLDAARPEYHRAVVSVSLDSGAGLLTAASTGGQRSSRVGSVSGANALLCLPSGTAPLRKGTRVDALLMGDVWGAAS